MNDRGIQYWQQFGQWEQEQNSTSKEFPMGRYAKESSGGEFQQAPEGNHIARCIQVVDLGTQHGEYQGKPRSAQKVLITWELPDEKMDNGDPFIVSAFFTNSLNEKATLRSILESWRNKAFTVGELQGFDLANILGTACMVSVIHNDKGRARVASVAAMPKGVKSPPAVNDQFCYWIEEHDDDTYQKIGEGIRKMIEQSDEWKGRHNKPASKSGGIPDMDDDIPF